jgi:hypothetical protein
MCRATLSVKCNLERYLTLRIFRSRGQLTWPASHRTCCGSHSRMSEARWHEWSIPQRQTIISILTRCLHLDCSRPGLRSQETGAYGLWLLHPLGCFCQWSYDTSSLSERAARHCPHRHQASVFDSIRCLPCPPESEIQAVGVRGGSPS